jgi:hypothetical protein
MSKSSDKPRVIPSLALQIVVRAFADHTAANDLSRADAAYLLEMTDKVVLGAVTPSEYRTAIALHPSFDSRITALIAEIEWAAYISSPEHAAEAESELAAMGSATANA